MRRVLLRGAGVRAVAGTVVSAERAGGAGEGGGTGRPAQSIY